MLSLFDQAEVYFARDPVDMRKQIDGLSSLLLDPFSACLFAFCNRQRDKMKILYWHDNGFCVLYKRLEKGRFKWPSADQDVLLCSARELKWLLDGLSLDSLENRERLSFKFV